jgi:hypothetical protein
MSDNFFSRWSRRKQGIDTTEVTPTQTDKPVVSPLSTVQSANGQATSAPASTSAASPTQPLEKTAQEPQTPVPTMDDVQHLTPQSDYQGFMRQGVPGEVRNAAMKKLFTDPHFNVMDGLDIYIGDYNTPDPLPAGMLEKMVGAEFLNLFPPKVPDLPPALGHSPVPENPGQSPDASEDSPLVAQSPPSPMTHALQATPALQASESTEHDHPDLQLQPNHAPASPDSGQSTG